MHAGDDRQQLTAGSHLTDLPEFGLHFLFDDGSVPTSVTVYDPDALETTWITVDVDAAVSLDDLR